MNIYCILLLIGFCLEREEHGAAFLSTLEERFLSLHLSPNDGLLLFFVSHIGVLSQSR